MLLALYVLTSIIWLGQIEPIKPKGLELFFGTAIWGTLLSLYIFHVSWPKLKAREAATLTKLNLGLSGIFMLCHVVLFSIFLYSSTFR